MEHILNWSVDLNNFYFGILGIFGAHCFYKSTRTRFKTILTWTILFLFWAISVELLYVVMPIIYQERAQMFIGYTGIFAYLYLFSHIPITQRIFTYFFVDCSIYLSMILARILAILATSYLHINGEIAFFVTGTIAGIILLITFKRLSRIVVQALPIFAKSFIGLTIFSATVYTAVLLLVDVWGTWPLNEPLLYFKYLILIISVCAGYYMAFYTLQIASKQKDEEQRSDQLRQQLSMNEKYYNTLLDSISQTRIHNHDLKHHVNTLDVLCKEGKYEPLSQYISSMAENLPYALPTIYCQDLALNALLNHMEQLYRQKNLTFDCAIHLPKNNNLDSMHLCIIFGNALQNAIEASGKLSHDQPPFVDCSTTYEDKNIVITISNRFDGKPLVKKENSYASSKKGEDHGLGLGSIRTVVEKYNGWMGVEIEEDVFTLKLILHQN